jgi:glycerol-3-phosphate dehydrogenase
MTASKFPVANPTASFWLTQPHHLASYRSSETTPEECDIAIIGTGLAGVSTAYHILANHKGTEPKIVLFDARQACSGATGRNGK